MLKIKLKDHKCLEDTINALLVSTEEISEIEMELEKDEGYAEILRMMDTITDMMGEMPEFELMEEYKEAVENKAGYEVNAAYLRGIKTGFNLAMFLVPEADRQHGTRKAD